MFGKAPKFFRRLYSGITNDVAKVGRYVQCIYQRSFVGRVFSTWESKSNCFYACQTSQVNHHLESFLAPKNREKAPLFRALIKAPDGGCQVQVTSRGERRKKDHQNTMNTIADTGLTDEVHRKEDY